MNLQMDEDLKALIKHSLRNRGCIDLPASGVSMFPYIRSGKIYRFLPPDFTLLKKGSIILYVSLSGQLIAHRFYRIRREGDEVMFLCKGDTNLGCDPWIKEDQIIGVLVSMRDNKRDKVKYVGDFGPSVWSFLVMNVPYVSYLLNIYLKKNRWMSRFCHE